MNEADRAGADDRDRLEDHVVEEVVDEPGTEPRQEVSSDEDDPDRELQDGGG